MNEVRNKKSIEMFRRVVVPASVAVLPLILTSNRFIRWKRYSVCDSANEQQQKEDDDAYWEKKKAECSFCRMFLESPCSSQFKLWSRCVDRAKEEEKDFKEECSIVSSALFACTSENHEYFQQLTDAMDAEEEEGEGEGEAEGHSAAVELEGNEQKLAS